MSELRRSQRLQQATDFSIARILRAEEPNSSSSSSSSSGYPSEDRVPRLPNNCACCPQDSGSSFITPMISTAEDRDHPLGEEFDKRVHEPRIIQEEEKNSSQGSSQGILQAGDLPWIHCTRYRPPRLPKRSSAGKVSKRRPGKHPRIPFTPFQLEILEDKYKKGAYLARRDVVQLSLILRLPQSRVSCVKNYFFFFYSFFFELNHIIPFFFFPLICLLFIIIAISLARKFL